MSFRNSRAATALRTTRDRKTARKRRRKTGTPNIAARADDLSTSKTIKYVQGQKR